MTSSALQLEAEVRDLLTAWTDAVKRRDLQGILQNHSPDIVMFDVPPPEQLRGIDDYKKSWDLFFQYLPREGGVFDITEMEIVATGDLAFAYGLLRCGGHEHSFPVRLTMCLKRANGAWMIVHEHHSVPARE